MRISFDLQENVISLKIYTFNQIQSLLLHQFIENQTINGKKYFASTRFQNGVNNQSLISINFRVKSTYFQVEFIFKRCTTVHSTIQ